MILSTIIFLVGMIALYEVESSTDKTYSELGQTEKQNKKWHREDALYLAILGAIIIFGYFGITWASLFAISYIGLLRMSYFNIRLNMRRGKPLFYLGKSGWDKFFEKDTKKYFISVISLTIINILILLYYAIF